MKNFYKNALNTLLIFFLAYPAGHAQDKFTDLGPQVSAALPQGSAFARDQSQREYVYTVVRGKPAHLLGFDIETGKLLTDLELANTDGSWDIAVSTDNQVYVAGGNGHLFRHQPGSHQLEDLGLVLPNEKVVFDLTAGNDGEIFGGTYPGCRVFRFHPKEGFSDAGAGALVENQYYVRSLEYHSQTDKLYAGIGSQSHLVELDPRTGAKREMLPMSDQNHQFIYSMGLIEGLPGGSRLFSWLTSSSNRQTLVYNLNSLEREKILLTIDVRSVIKDKKSDQVYYTADNQLFTADFSKKSFNPTRIPGISGTALATAWSKNQQLLLLMSGGKLVRYDPVKKISLEIQLSIPPQPIDIQTIGLGPDGRMWSGGYLAGGHAAYDPKTGKTESYNGLHQTEGMTMLGKNIYFGIYPKAEIYTYNTEAAWDLKARNPKLIMRIAGQDRPFTGIAVEETGMIIFGTVPDYGKLGGVLFQYDSNTGQTKIYDTIIKNQSIVSLVNTGDYILGGTSISGGLGIEPVESDAKIFGWDSKSENKLFELVPVPGVIAITALMKAKDGNIWGVAEGTLFVFDPQKKTVVSSYEIFPPKPRGTHTWRNGFLLAHSNGKVYLSVNNNLYQVDPDTMKIDKIADDASLLTMDKEGKLYFRRGTNLWSYDPGEQLY